LYSAPESWWFDLPGSGTVDARDTLASCYEPLEREIDMSKPFPGITTGPVPSWVPSGSTVNQIRARERSVAAERQRAAETLRLWAVDAYGQPDDERRLTMCDLQPGRFDE
jgi:hypothetical protein